MTVELGIDTFGDVTWDDDDRPVSHAQTVRNVVEQGVLADQVGLHSIGIGEHHRDDFAISAPDVVLAGIVGALLAVPTLMASWYGMNFEFMPE